MLTKNSEVKLELAIMCDTQKKLERCSLFFIAHEKQWAQISHQVSKPEHAVAYIIMFSLPTKNC